MNTLYSIEIEGFGSIVKLAVYKLNKPGLNLISGNNGVGKSTIVNAICWVTYKQLAKKGSSIVPWEKVQGEKFMGTMVKLNFGNDKNRYSIIRCNGYKREVAGKNGNDRLIIMENEKEILELRDKKDQEEWIKNKLGYSFDLFRNTILFGQKMTRLMSEDGPTKKRVFDQAFETLFIDRAKEVVSKRLSCLMDEIQLLGVSKDAEQKVWENMENSVLEEEKRNKAIKREIRFEKKKLQSRPDISKELKARDKYKSQIDGKAVGHEFKLMLEINKAETDLGNIDEEIKDIKGELRKPKKFCTKCGQPLNEDGWKAQRRKLKEKLTEQTSLKGIGLIALGEMKKEHERAKEGVKAQEFLNTSIKAIDVLEKKVKLIKEGNNLIKAVIKEKRRELNRKISLVSIDKLKEQENLVNDLTQQIKDINKKIDVDEWLLKDPLSNAGLKAYIFDNMLAIVNKNCRAYKHISGFDIKVYVDMDKANKSIDIIMYKGEQKIPYADLSGGQSQLVDIVLAFAMNDTVYDIKPINILFLDEAFESLDNDNIEKVGDLLQYKSKTRNIHLITHRKEFNPPNVNSIELILNSLGQTEVI